MNDVTFQFDQDLFFRLSSHGDPVSVHATDLLIRRRRRIAQGNDYQVLTYFYHLDHDWMSESIHSKIPIHVLLRPYFTRPNRYNKLSLSWGGSCWQVVCALSWALYLLLSHSPFFSSSIGSSFYRHESMATGSD